MIEAAEIIETPRFRLRALAEDDATERYSRWLDEEGARRFIVSARERHDIQAIRAYIADKSRQDDVMFLGIFTKAANEHIGNIKYEPVDRGAGRATMGILIGEPEWRGKGVAEEVISATAEWLRRHCGVTEIILGVAKDNRGGIKAYEKAGFTLDVSGKYAGDPAYANTYVMVRCLASST